MESPAGTTVPLVSVYPRLVRRRHSSIITGGIASTIRALGSLETIEAIRSTWSLARTATALAGSTRNDPLGLASGRACTLTSTTAGTSSLEGS